MEIDGVYPPDIGIEGFKAIQTNLLRKVKLRNVGIDNGINFCAGVDVAYWLKGETEWGVCCIIVIDYTSGQIIEKLHSSGRVKVPYLPGYLAFRELPLVIRTARKLANTPDLFMFDGNGYLHPRHMGIATHASLFLNKPTIGVAKSYFKINNSSFRTPRNEVGSYADITVGNKVYGRVLRTHKDVKPIYISCGNYIDLPTTTEITLKLTNSESRLPIPVRLADLATRRIRRKMIAGK